METSGYGSPVSEAAAALEESLSMYSRGSRFLAGRTDRLVDGERRKVAVLFLGIALEAGSGGTTDHDLFHGVLAGIMDFLSSVVESFGGYVDKSEGARLMALFGARSAAENDSARAVGCGLRMVEILREVGPALPEGSSLQAGAGINSGTVVVAPDPAGHLTATGSTVNLASRIEEMAEPGTVFVSSGVREECGDLFEFDSRGSFAVRGTSSTVCIYQPAGPGRLRKERWERAARLSGIPIFGRERELERLEELVGRAFGDTPGTVLARIRGEAGIGKSRLLHHLLESIGGVAVLHGHTEHFSRTPFSIWLDILRGYLRTMDDSEGVIADKLAILADGCPDGRLAAKVREEIPRLTAFLLYGGPDAGGGSPEESRALAVAIRLVLSALSASGPLLLALEDLHWMDEASARVLQLFTGSVGDGAGVMIAATERPPESGPAIEEKGWEIMELDPLGSSPIAAICDHLLSDGGEPADMDPCLTDFLHNGARGNPFYAEELVLSLHEIGGIVRGSDGRWRLTTGVADIGVPPGVAALIQSRVDMLPGEERRILQIASVIGTAFRKGLLKKVTSGLGLREYPEVSVQKLVEKGFLIPENGGRLSFRHDLVRSSVYGTTLMHNRRIVHGITAEACEELYSDETGMMATVVFDHWRLAGRSGKMLEWSDRALAGARDGDLVSEIIRIAGHVLEVTGRDSSDGEWSSRMFAMELMQAALGRSGNLSEALDVTEEFLAEASAGGRPDWEAVALRARGIHLNEMGRHEEIEAVYARALEMARVAGDGMLIARVHGSIANFYSDTGRNDLALENYRAAREILVREGSREQLASALCNTANLMVRLGRREEAAKEFLESIRICRERGMRASLGYSLNGYAILLAMENRLEEAEKVFEEALDCQRDIGNRPLESSITGNLGVLTRMLGDLPRSLEYRESALRMVRSCGSRRSLAIALVNMASIHRLMENKEAALSYCGEARSVAESIRDPASLCHAVSIQGMLYLAMGRRKDAMEACEEAIRLVESHGISSGTLEDLDDFLGIMMEYGLPCRRPSNWEDGGTGEL
ncbi:MAG: hypothetical protein AVO35_06745 [Candidatus Aegiribacteria sp. MLS_C]|nr:MAG: hypothetical protein AVO35_06745 [Candidatus Aegiribacteria sp. MLS_C]